jgi:hypothetical protein
VAAGLTAALAQTGTPTRGIGTDLEGASLTIDELRDHQKGPRAALQRARGNAALLVVRMDDPESVDVQEVAAVADAVLLVADTDARTRDTRSALRALDEVGAPLLCVVLVGGPRRAGRREVLVPDDDAQASDTATEEV